MSERRCPGTADGKHHTLDGLWCTLCGDIEPQEGASSAQALPDDRSVLGTGGGAPSCDSADWRERMRAALLSGTGHKEAGEFLRMVDELRTNLRITCETEAVVRRQRDELREDRVRLYESLQKSAAQADEFASERDELRAKLATVSREYADVAHAIGIAYEAEGHPIVPGPVALIIKEIRELQFRSRLSGELEAKLAEAGQKFETSVGLLNETYDASVKRLEAKLASAETNWESMTEAWERATERAEAAEARVSELITSLKPAT
jgi:hypothetical protein